MVFTDADARTTLDHQVRFSLLWIYYRMLACLHIARQLHVPVVAVLPQSQPSYAAPKRV